MDSNFDLYSTTIIGVMYAISCYAGSRYNGARQYIVYCATYAYGLHLSYCAVIPVNDTHKLKGHFNGPLARCVKLCVAHAPAMQGSFFPPTRLTDPDMHHGTCVTHVP